MQIGTRDEYEYYLEADRASLEMTRHRPRLFGDEIWRFQRLLRKIEYYEMRPPSLFNRLYLTYLGLRFHRLSMLLGFSIPTQIFGPGLSIAHRGTIVVNSWARTAGSTRAPTSAPGRGRRARRR